MTNSNGVNSSPPPAAPPWLDGFSESYWQDLSYLLPDLEEEIASSPLVEHAAEWIAEDRLVSEAARLTGLLGSEQPLKYNFEPDFKLFLEQGFLNMP
ncbi:MAG: hypothetical protein LLG04_11790 [Parachlamydia sp.]|nr:hypothetical protein [Parachlamydia sp.]